MVLPPLLIWLSQNSMKESASFQVVKSSSSTKLLQNSREEEEGTMCKYIARCFRYAVQRHFQDGELLLGCVSGCVVGVIQE